jgi:hypothetical protein
MGTKAQRVFRRLDQWTTCHPPFDLLAPRPIATASRFNLATSQHPHGPPNARAHRPERATRAPVRWSALFGAMACSVQRSWSYSASVPIQTRTTASPSARPAVPPWGWRSAHPHQLGKAILQQRFRFSDDTFHDLPCGRDVADQTGVLPDKQRGVVRVTGRRGL